MTFHLEYSHMDGGSYTSQRFVDFNIKSRNANLVGHHSSRWQSGIVRRDTTSDYLKLYVSSLDFMF